MKLYVLIDIVDARTILISPVKDELIQLKGRFSEDKQPQMIIIKSGVDDEDLSKAFALIDVVEEKILMTSTSQDKLGDLRLQFSEDMQTRTAVIEPTHGDGELMDAYALVDRLEERTILKSPFKERLVNIRNHFSDEKRKNAVILEPGQEMTSYIYALVDTASSKTILTSDNEERLIAIRDRFGGEQKRHTEVIEKALPQPETAPQPADDDLELETKKKGDPLFSKKFVTVRYHFGLEYWHKEDNVWYPFPVSVPVWIKDSAREFLSTTPHPYARMKIFPYKIKIYAEQKGREYQKPKKVVVEEIEEEPSKFIKVLNFVFGHE